MIKQLKSFTVNVVAGANVATVLLMLGAGYADRINPISHPMLSNLGMLFSNGRRYGFQSSASLWYISH